MEHLFEVRELKFTDPTNSSSVITMSFPVANKTFLQAIQSANEQLYTGIALIFLSIGTPSFIQPIENASAVIGRDAMLNCFIDNAQGFKIAWIRVDTQTILTMNENVISRNHRFYIDHNKLDRQWSLSIREVKPSDQGWYMCQINTDPMMSTTGYLEVLGTSAIYSFFLLFIKGGWCAICLTLTYSHRASSADRIWDQSRFRGSRR
ncbi:hypothetical protein TCAL_05178 [Tigriopus californicus]|uniref:Ig-like domain-containing protein n=1 Tax=Tigriopus californicus TaxID=6832 RepID=A0A553NPG5_TIGCA|nr:hypothetical protein TCAL_05178 [Tigriopus californicus]